METLSRSSATRNSPHAVLLPAHWAGQEARLSETRPYQLVSRRIQELILQSAIGPGERLPPERKLASLLAVSRPMLREALIALEMTGIVEVRSGSGVYVRSAPQPPAPVQEADPTPDERLSARRLIEPELAAMAARVATDSSLDAILAAVVEMEQIQLDHLADKSSFRLADHHFHVTIARATGNGELARILERLLDQGAQLSSASESFLETGEQRQEDVEGRWSIVRAIAAHDAGAARRAMRTHLERTAHGPFRG